MDIMQFEPMGGFPPIVRITDTKIPENVLDTRGFTSSNIVSINQIMKSKRKEDLFSAFGTDDKDEDEM